MRIERSRLLSGVLMSKWVSERHSIKNIEQFTAYFRRDCLVHGLAWGAVSALLIYVTGTYLFSKQPDVFMGGFVASNPGYT